MTEHTEELKQEIIANILSTNNLNPKNVKCNWRYDEETDENWLSLLVSHTVKSSTSLVADKKKSRTNMSIIKQLGN